MFVMVVIVCVSLGDDTLDSRITRNGPDLLPMSPVVFAQAIGSRPKESAFRVSHAALDLHRGFSFQAQDSGESKIFCLVLIRSNP